MPRAIYKDPFRGGDNIIVMCDTYEPPRMQPDGTMTPIKPIPTNTRHACNEVRAVCGLGCTCISCLWGLCTLLSSTSTWQPPFDPTPSQTNINQ